MCWLWQFLGRRNNSAVIRFYSILIESLIPYRKKDYGHLPLRLWIFNYSIRAMAQRVCCIALNAILLTYALYNLHCRFNLQYLSCRVSCLERWCPISFWSVQSNHLLGVQSLRYVPFLATLSVVTVVHFVWNNFKFEPAGIGTHLLELKCRKIKLGKIFRVSRSPLNYPKMFWSVKHGGDSLGNHATGWLLSICSELSLAVEPGLHPGTPTILSSALRSIVLQSRLKRRH